MRRGTPVRFSVAALAALVLSGCGTDTGPMTLLDDLLASVPIFSSMRESVSYDRYEMPRTPVEGTVPMRSPGGEVPAPFTVDDLETVAAALENPLPRDSAVLFRGEQGYRVHCAVCHADDGSGVGPVVAPDKFPMPMPLIGASTRGRTDGYIYGVIRVGRGFMPPYADRIPHEERWAIVHYVRHLQGEEPVVADPATPDIDPEDVAPQPETPLPDLDEDVEVDADGDDPEADTLEVPGAAGDAGENRDTSDRR